LPASKPAQGPLPVCLLENTQVPGYRQKQWVPRELQPSEREDVQRCLDLIEARLVPAPREVIIALVARAMVHDHRDRSEREIAMICEDYADDLTGYSEAHIASAIKEHRRTNNWFPKPAELRALCSDRKVNADVMRHRARGLLGIRPLENWEKSLIAKVEDEREQKRRLGHSAAAHGDVGDRLQKLPPELAAQARGLIDAAKKNESSQKAE
jgi:hypothetical protein